MDLQGRKHKPLTGNSSFAGARCSPRAPPGAESICSALPARASVLAWISAWILSKAAKEGSSRSASILTKKPIKAVGAQYINARGAGSRTCLNISNNILEIFKQAVMVKY